MGPARQRLLNLSANEVQSHLSGSPVIGCRVCFPLWLGFGDLLPRQERERKPLLSFTTANLSSVEFSSKMSSLLPFMYSLCPEPCFPLRCYHCAFHTDALSLSACAAWFLSLLKFQSRIRATMCFQCGMSDLDFCSYGVHRHHVLSHTTTFRLLSIALM